MAGLVADYIFVEPDKTADGNKFSPEQVEKLKKALADFGGVSRSIGVGVEAERNITTKSSGVAIKLMDGFGMFAKDIPLVEDSKDGKLHVTSQNIDEVAQAFVKAASEGRAAKNSGKEPSQVEERMLGTLRTSISATNSGKVAAR